ncbi:S-methyl-5-thioribose-1-phosphate isomerase [Miniphocaeibacter halophilus]|uniref:S-methyl-5-thioribose-1-phosphate isomerase n=1 Tax=Miniphocaeibacter halophilus TaxID=2931922 RepID=A0AC61MSD2_9FIRM|nr:S-methyl-5-thioribose-1-phosphate isomerase [Miniphocaeibacter halophilus]QQK07218.1 S-methyl-5-thioribose-1-phosphate isomerase [Miniphocaeibacter halophilus]
MKPTNVNLNENKSAVVILDQTKIPNEEIYLELKTAKEMYDAIFELKVRGAPAIGICAAYSIYILAKNINADDYNEFLSVFKENKEYLNSSRPTAVNLSWALERMEKVVISNKGKSIDDIVDLLEREAIEIQEEDIEMCRKISELGLSLLEKEDGILTHCNAGPMATSLYGTALGPILLGQEKGYNFRVFADETRPLLQGARLTSYELDKADVDVTLICDNMASIVMKNGWINACLVGCDRIAANGDVANKIGTSGVAILAKYYNIPFYVLGPTSTLDMGCKTGNDIKIELRDGNEIKEKFYKKPMAPKRVNTYNPAFDVTDNSLITAIITEKGICRPPFKESLLKISKK